MALHDRRREARPRGRLHPRRAVGALRPGARVSPATADDPDRDRFLLSKGHGPMAYYAVLAAKGFFPLDGSRLGAFDSPLGHHPDRMLVPGVEISSGSLGHGLPLGVGIALGLRAQGRRRPGRRAGRRRRARRGQQPRGDRVRRRARPGRLTVVVVDNRRRRTAGPAASPPGSPPRAGDAAVVTAATTTPSRQR